MPTPPVPPERLDAAARAQVGVTAGTTAALRRVHDDRVADLWSLAVDTPDRLAIAFLWLHDGRVAVPAGLDQAGRALAAMNVLAEPAWNGSLIHFVAAAGGWTPGWPDVPIVEEARTGGGARLTIRTPVPWVRYAAAGGAGPPPPTSSAPGGVTAPDEVGTVTLDITADHDLRWTWRAGGRELGSCGARRAAAPPALSDDDLLAVLDAARRRARAPRAMPMTEPHPLDPARPAIVTVELCVLGAVHVDREAHGPPDPTRRLRELGIDLAQPPSPATLLPVLEAVGALPSGLLASDLHAATIAGGELIAEAAAPLVEWSHAGATGLTPRSPRWLDEGNRAPRGRLRVQLASLRWTFELGDGSTWRALP
jgi:hypothetical protein